MEGLEWVDGPLRAFVEGHTVPETSKYVPEEARNEHNAAFVIAGILQGLTIGYEYAKRVE